jgi:hypothetical protein
VAEWCGPKVPCFKQAALAKVLLNQFTRVAAMLANFFLIQNAFKPKLELKPLPQECFLPRPIDSDSVASLTIQILVHFHRERHD